MKTVRLHPGSVAAIFCLLLLPAWLQAKPKELSVDLPVTVVEVDLLAQDKKGDFVTDLTKEDFEVFENGKKVKLLDFELRSIIPLDALLAGESSPIGQKASPPSEKRKFILFVDLLNSGVESVRLLKRHLLEFVQQTLGPHDEMMVAILAPNRRTLLLQKFTGDKASMARAIHALRGNPETSNRDESHEQNILDFLDPEPGGAGGGVQSAGNVNMIQLQTNIGSASDMVKAYALQQYARGELAIEAMTAVVQKVEEAGWQRGRKCVIFVSETLPLRPAQGFFDLVNRRIDDYNRAIERLPAEEFHQRMFPIRSEYDLMKVVDRSTGRLNRIGATLYTIDIQGVLTSATQGVSRKQNRTSYGQQMSTFLEQNGTLNALAADTGGLSFFNISNYGKALNSIEQDNRARYFLTYKPPKHPKKKKKKKKKAKFYEIKVKCKRPGVKIRARKGYTD